MHSRKSYSHLPHAYGIFPYCCTNWLSSGRNGQLHSYFSPDCCVAKIKGTISWKGTMQLTPLMWLLYSTTYCKRNSDGIQKMALQLAINMNKV